MAQSLMQNWDLLFPSTAAIWLNSVLNFVQISDVFLLFFSFHWMGFVLKWNRQERNFMLYV